MKHKVRISFPAFGMRLTDLLMVFISNEPASLALGQQNFSDSGANQTTPAWTRYTTHLVLHRWFDCQMMKLKKSIDCFKREINF